jgi:hypothetical protein
VTPFVVVLGVFLALLVPLAFVAGVRLGVLKSSSKLTAAESVFKASAAVSRIAERTASRGAQDWTLAQRLEALTVETAGLQKQLENLNVTSDRMDVTLAKVAEWTVMAPGRKRLQPQSPVDQFIARASSALPSVPLFPEEDEAQLARPASPTERGTV